jgi:DNA-binding CsgD family transcriptional regulator
VGFRQASSLGTFAAAPLIANGGGQDEAHQRRLLVAPVRLHKVCYGHGYQHRSRGRNIVNTSNRVCEAPVGSFNWCRPYLPIDGAMRREKPSVVSPFGLAELTGGAFDCWILDQSGHVLDSNQPSGRAKAVEVRCGKVTMLDSRAQRVLEQLLSRVPAEVAEHWGCALSPAGSAIAFVKFVIFTQAQRQAFRGASMAVVAFDGQIRCSPSPELLRLLFGLTPAEARVAVGLMGGGTAREIARDRRLALVTVRTQLKHILAKMHMQRQADVIAILGRLAGFAGPNLQITAGR